MSVEKKLEIEIKDNYWRNTGRSVTILGLNAFVVVPYLFFLFRLTMFTLYVAIAITIILIVMKVRGYTPLIAFRAIKSRLAGSVVKRDRRINRHKMW